MIKTVKYTRDILPEEFTNDLSAQSHRFQHVEAVAREAFRRYGYREIRTPIFEHTELFARGVGQETDIVSKEMYSWTDVNNDRLTLRPENTAPVIRSYIEHKMWASSDLVKLFYIGPMFRRERGQKGRFRQFYQIGVEVLGKSDNPAIEAEVIEMIYWILDELKISDTELLVNSVGCPACRPQFNETLRRELAPLLRELCADCNRRYETNILRVLDCKQDAERTAQLTPILDLLCRECNLHFLQFRSYLDHKGIPYRVEPRLVRGLDYYTRTAFEVTSRTLGAQSALLGGGRYDGLSETLGGPPTKGFGFALGLDRFVMSLPHDLADPSRPELYIAYLGERAFAYAMTLISKLRRQGIACVMDFEQRSLRSAMKLADKLKVAKVLIVGDNELDQGQLILRDMRSGEQQLLTEDELLRFFHGQK
ncbi:MAG: histidine--tRNA ligase [Acidobacteriota bacterium]|nr:histidine--tRNA ligase [Blastocatellia bacterium]MDW8412005.1 histidine--tRNA ligase [Acidobacteriota bacterium]